MRVVCLQFWRKCRAQPIPKREMLWNGIPTKTPLAHSQFSGRLLSLLRVPAQVFSTRCSGSTFFLYLFLLVMVLSWSSLLLVIASAW